MILILAHSWEISLANCLFLASGTSQGYCFHRHCVVGFLLCFCCGFVLVGLFVFVFNSIQSAAALTFDISKTVVILVQSR